MLLRYNGEEYAHSIKGVGVEGNNKYKIFLTWKILVVPKKH